MWNEAGGELENTLLIIACRMARKLARPTKSRVANSWIPGRKKGLRRPARPDQAYSMSTKAQERKFPRTVCARGNREDLAKIITRKQTASSVFFTAKTPEQPGRPHAPSKIYVSPCMKSIRLHMKRINWGTPIDKTYFTEGSRKLELGIDGWRWPSSKVSLIDCRWRSTKPAYPKSLRNHQKARLTLTIDACWGPEVNNCQIDVDNWWWLEQVRSLVN